MQTTTKICINFSKQKRRTEINLWNVVLSYKPNLVTKCQCLTFNSGNLNLAAWFVIISSCRSPRVMIYILHPPLQSASAVPNSQTRSRDGVWLNPTECNCTKSFLSLFTENPTLQSSELIDMRLTCPAHYSSASPTENNLPRQLAH